MAVERVREATGDDGRTDGENASGATSPTARGGFALGARVCVGVGPRAAIAEVTLDFGDSLLVRFVEDRSYGRVPYEEVSLAERRKPVARPELPPDFLRWLSPGDVPRPRKRGRSARLGVGTPGPRNLPDGGRPPEEQLPAPACVHHWDLDSWGAGSCRHCGERKEFRSPKPRRGWANAARGATRRS